MPESLPALRPSCPSCGTPLERDGSEYGCPRCGHAYLVTVLDGPTEGTYRGSPVFDIVPLTNTRPPFGLRAASSLERALDSFFEKGNPGAWRHLFRGDAHDPLPLNAFIGNALVLLNPVLRFLGFVLALGYFAWLWLPLGNPGPLLTIVLGAVVMAQVASVAMPKDRLLERGDRLVWQRFRGGKLKSEDSVELTRIVAVFNESEQVRIVLDDGNSWEIGKGLTLPRGVTRWLARRVARRLPPPSEIKLLPADTGSD
jgi:hypothetical protein